MSKLSGNPMHWLSLDEFMGRWNKRHKPNKEGMVQSICIDVGYQELEAMIPVSGDKEYLDGLGEALLWYGEADGELFSIESMVMEGSNISTILVPTDMGLISDNWECIKALEYFPVSLVNKVQWIKGSGSGAFSVFYKDDQVVRQVYSGASQSSAELLKEYLESNGSPLTLCVAETESYNDTWIGVRINGSDHNVMCRYQRRDTTEDFVAAKKLKDPESSFMSKCEGLKCTNSWVVFRQDDHGNRFHMQDYQFHVDAVFCALEYEAKGHHQTYCVERKAI